VGPGDPELLTLRAIRAIEASDLIVHPGRDDRAGIAYEVVSELVRSTQRVRGMALAMMRGRDDGSVGYDRVAGALVEEARNGHRAVFLTEGDPMLYGTGSYVVERLKVLAADLAFEVIPGVSALGAVAARLGWPLARKDEILTVCPGTYHVDEIGAILDRGGPVCWFKSADVLPRLIDELAARGRLDDAVLVERVGHPAERVFFDLRDAAGQNLSYFSLVLVR
jgi:precorrin-2/cobalt-factor-2 C20-methyltransferase